jgi:hypothetical protein
MKMMSFKSAIKPILGGAVVSALLAALPAKAGSGLTKITHSPNYSQWAAKPAQPVVAKVPPTPSSKHPEVQVAVMAKAPSQAAAKRSVFIHR